MKYIIANKEMTVYVGCFQYSAGHYITRNYNRAQRFTSYQEAQEYISCKLSTLFQYPEAITYIYLVKEGL